MNSKKGIGIGVSDFKNLTERNCYYIDKTLLIKDILDTETEVILFPRPRRFGKTLNLSMLRYYFEKTEKDNSFLFKDYAIWRQGEEYIKHQGKYPVIYLTFKDVKQDNWEFCYENITSQIAKIYKEHRYLLEEGVLYSDEIVLFESIINLKASQVQYEQSILNLSSYLEKHFNQKVILLMDEYDTPIHARYIGKYYDQIIGFMRGFLSGALKDNASLKKGILTGILRVAKESIFSGLNNLDVSTVLSKQFDDKFGLTEEEVQEMLNYFGIPEKMSDVKEWYNGYKFGNSIIYNPWSIINYVKKHDEGLKPYWINTSSNDIVRQVITRSSEVVKKELGELIEGKNITKQVNENIVFGDIEKSSSTIWNFLLFSGYLKAENIKLVEESMFCDLSIPNKEVLYLYKEIIMNWFNESIFSDKLEAMLKGLTTGDTELFEDIFAEFVMKTFSCFDPSGESPENVYHAFVLGLLINLDKTHEVKSNGESGKGRYDVVLFPRDEGNRQACSLGVIIEFKKVNKRRKETLEKAAETALDQIERKQYKTELINRGIKDILSLGIAFEGKEIMMREKREQF